MVIVVYSAVARQGHIHEISISLNHDTIHWEMDDACSIKNQYFINNCQRIDLLNIPPPSGP